MRDRTTGTILRAALLGGLLLCAVATVASAAEAADRSTARVGVSVGARVVPYTRIERAHHPSALVITEEDIERGSVLVPGASELIVATNSRHGYRLSFRIDADFVRRVTVSGLGSTAILGSRGGWVEQRATSAEATSILGYELFLTEDAAPGRYPWPVAITAERLGAGR